MKKAYIIPLVILLLFVFVVPCFAAQDPSNSVLVCYYAGSTVRVNAIPMSRSYALNFSKFSTTLTFSYVNKASFSLFVNGVYQADYAILNNDVTLSFSPGDVICILDGGSSQSVLYSVSGVKPSFIMGYANSEVPNIPYWPVYYIYSGGYFTVPDGYYTVNGTFDTVKSSDHFSGQNYVFEPAKASFKPFTDFYSSLAESFSYFPDLISDYAYVFIFIGAIISILVFIFLTVFIIKRFTGGKC